eukprot:5271876-Prorocentrum_lima.AAC.1
MPWHVLCRLPPGSQGLVAIIAAMNLLAVLGKEAYMRRTLVRMGVAADEWLHEVTGRRLDGL